MNLPFFPRHDPALVTKLCEQAVEIALLRARPTREPRRDKRSIREARDAMTARLRQEMGR